MSLSSVLQQRVSRVFRLYTDLVETLESEQLGADLAPLPSNTLGSQLWCVVGARESYTRALIAGDWQGFSCSLDSADRVGPIRDALTTSAAQVSEALDHLESFSDSQHHLLVDLLEHEVAHHGQLIRYLYGLKIPIPESWKRRYALD